MTTFVFRGCVIFEAFFLRAATVNNFGKLFVESITDREIIGVLNIVLRSSEATFITIQPQNNCVM
jgi:hypothetical protein